MTDGALRARLVNAGGELIAEGPCWLDEAAGHATLEPERTPGAIQKQRGALALELETGRSLPVSDRLMIVRIRPPGRGPTENGMRSLYRLRLIHAQDAEAAGAAGEGAPASPQASPRQLGETPAAR